MNIADCHKWTEEHTTVQKHPFGTFALASRFLTLALVWRTFRILKNAKQGGKPARREPQNPAVENVPSGSQVP